MSEKIDWRKSEIIADLYEIKKKLGAGGMGEVWLVHHLNWNMDLAVKTPHPELVSSPMARQDFVMEAENWVNMDKHLNIATCFYVRELGGVPRIFVEYIDGGNLRDWMKKGRVEDWGTILRMLIEIVSGMAHAHKNGLIHRDLKPENLLLTKEGEVKLTDFGLAWRLNEESRDRRVAGTPPYMPPEQWEAREVGKETDIYAFGVIVFEMITGRQPYEIPEEYKEAIEELKINLYRQMHCESRIPEVINYRHDCPPSLSALITKCLQKRMENRYHNFDTVKGELMEIYQELVGSPYQSYEIDEVKLRADDLNNKALSLLDLGREEEAIVFWQAALKMYPHHLESVFNYGYTRWTCGEQSDSIYLERLRELAEIHGREPTYWRSLAKIHVSRGALEEAVKAFSKATELATKSWETQLEQAIVLLNIEGNEKDARQILANLYECWSETMEDKIGKRDVTEAVAYLRKVDLPCGRLLRKLRPTAKRPSQSRRSYGFVIPRHFLSAGLHGWLSQVAFTPDGHRAFSVADRKISEWDLRTGSCIRTLEIPPLAGATFTSDVQRVVGVTGNKLCLYDLEAEECLRVLELERQKKKAPKIAVGPDGCLVLISDGGSEGIFLLNLETGEHMKTFKGHNYSNSLHSIIAFGSRADFVLTGGGRSVCLWDVVSGMCRRTIVIGKKEERSWETVWRIVASPDGKRALIGGSKGTLYLWDFETGDLRVMEGHTNAVFGIAVSPDGRQALSASHDLTLRLWDIETGQCLRTFTRHEKTVSCVAFSPDGERGLSGDYDRTICLWKLHYPPPPRERQFTPVFTYLLNKPTSVAKTIRIAQTQQLLLEEASALLKTKSWQVAYNTLRQAQVQPGYEQAPDILERLAICGAHGRRVGLRDGWLARSLKGHTENVKAVAMSSDGKWALSGGADHTLRLWNLVTGECRLFQKQIGRITAVDMSADGRLVLVGSGNWMGSNKTYVLETESGHCLRVFEHTKRGLVGCVLFYGDAQFALAQCGRFVYLYDLQTGACLRTLECEKVVSCIALSPDAKFIVTGHDSGEIIVRDVSTGHKIRSLHTRRVLAVSVAVNGRLLISGNVSGVVELWDLSNGTRLYTWEEHKDQVNDVAILPDCRWAFSAAGSLNKSTDNTLRLWDLATGQFVRVFEAHTHLVNALAFSPDGRYVLSASDDNTLQLWELDWNYEFPDPADWDEGARPYLETFLTLHSPLKQGLFARSVAPSWTEDDFQLLLVDLGYNGYGWLRPEGVRQKLKELVRKRQNC